MIGEGREDGDGTVTRLRRELDAVELRGGRSDVEGVLLRLHRRRHVQRRQRVLVSLTAVVVLALVGGGVAVFGRSGSTGIPVAAPVAEWAPRGELAGDAKLAEAARAVWPEGGSARVVYAGASPNRVASLVVVVLAAVDRRGDTRVAFATSLVDVEGNPDPTRLVLRATAAVVRGQRAVGFIAATPTPGDDPLNGGGALGFGLAEPGAAEITLHTSILDDQAPTPSPQPGVTWAVFQTGVGAWNTVALVDSVPVPLAAAAEDPQVQVTTLSRQDEAVFVLDDGRKHFAATPDGLVGVDHGDPLAPSRLSTDLTGLPVAVAITDTPGTLATVGGDLVFEPTGPTPPLVGNRVVLADPGNPHLMINVGVVTSASPYRVKRTVDPETLDPATTVLLVDAP